MAQHKLRSRIAQFKQPFLVGAVTSAALLSGCGGETQGTGANPDGLSGTSDECPTQAPALGETCNEHEPGLDCEYVGDTICPRKFRCSDGAWENSTPPCNPPRPDLIEECPAEEPTSGAPCNLYVSGLDCEYHIDTSCPREYRCSDGEWQDRSFSCNPPPPELKEECPVKTPATGQTCHEYEPGLECGYSDESGCQREFTCNDGEWDDVSPTCNPPPPELIDECPVKTPSMGQTCSEYEPGLDCGYGEESSCPREFTCSDGEWRDFGLICNPPPPESQCPEQPFSVGDSCEGYEQGLECETELVDTSCPEANILSCGASGEWEGPIVICNPPPPEPLTECPTDVPVAGESCEDYQIGLVCEHFAACDGGVGAVCGDDGVWGAVITFCNPPPVIETDSGVDSTEWDAG